MKESYSGIAVLKMRWTPTEQSYFCVQSWVALFGNFFTKVIREYFGPEIWGEKTSMLG